WTLATSPFGTDASYGTSIYGSNAIAVGASGKIAYSSDSGQTWTLVLSPPFGTDVIYGCYYNQFGSIAVGASGKLAYSLSEIGTAEYTKNLYIRIE
ncbi:hypothetical protein KW468_14500, partial [Vibrio fluvialis]|nr:hypothetical protein [Vibrio fluvialis]